MHVCVLVSCVCMMGGLLLLQSCIRSCPMLHTKVFLCNFQLKAPLTAPKRPPPCNCLQADGSALDLTKQLIGNNDEVTDIRFLGPPTAPTHLAVSSNSEIIRVFSLLDMSCTASLAGHTDTVLALDATPLLAKATGPPGLGTVLASGAKDNQVRVWECEGGRCLGVGEGHVAAVSAVAFTRR